jgi:hypothetical protein
MAVTAVTTVNSTAKTNGSGNHRLINSALCCAKRISTDPPLPRSARERRHHNLNHHFTRTSSSWARWWQFLIPHSESLDFSYLHSENPLQHQS